MRSSGAIARSICGYTAAIAFFTVTMFSGVRSIRVLHIHKVERLQGLASTSGVRSLRAMLDSEAGESTQRRVVDER